ncbi:MAG: hypothetical protein M9939_17025 [Mesorhizobium sp.]|nr:hypothetical protein [Mesorhizobium sp.]MCO5162839.1 hypothetical protein [Mesorhizobium sp.]
MNKFLLASVAVLGLAGSAVAQEVPAFYGENPYAATVDARQAGASHVVTGQANATVPGTDGFNINLNQNYSGK